MLKHVTRITYAVYETVNLYSFPLNGLFAVHTTLAKPGYSNGEGTRGTVCLTIYSYYLNTSVTEKMFVIFFFHMIRKRANRYGII